MQQNSNCLKETKGKEVVSGLVFIQKIIPFYYGTQFNIQ